jgi:histidine phosphotransferase ChpT
MDGSILPVVSCISLTITSTGEAGCDEIGENMADSSELNVDFAALLSARLCHDLAGPVGAVNNGAELLNEGDGEMLDDARDLISSCAGQAVRRLRFFRLAYGSHYGAMDWADAMQTSAAMLADSKIDFSWQGDYGGAERSEIANAGRLALNLVLLAGNGLPRGGTLEFRAAGEAKRPILAVEGAGSMAVFDENSAEALAGGCRRDGAMLKEMNARFVQPYLTGYLAAGLGLMVRAAASDDGKFDVTTVPA